MSYHSKRCCASCRYLIQEHEGNGFEELFKCRVSNSGKTICDNASQLNINWCAYWDERKFEQIDGLKEIYG